MLSARVFNLSSLCLSLILIIGVLWHWFSLPVAPVDHTQKQPDLSEQSQPEDPQQTALPQNVTLILPPPPPSKPVATPPPPVVAQAPVNTPEEQPKTPEPRPAPITETVVQATADIIKETPPPPKPEQPKPQTTVSQAQAQAQAQPQSPPMEAPVEITEADQQEGRSLLRVLEHGKGPLIEISWPEDGSARAKLYETFVACFGMENALMDKNGNLYRTEETRRTRWEINLDRYSAFIRQPNGRLSAAEKRTLSQIDRHHGGIARAQPVRIFPRNVDASLLGGLKSRVGGQYLNLKRLSAEYILDGQNVHIDHIKADGQPLAGQIRLRPYSHCRGRA